MKFALILTPALALGLLAPALGQSKEAEKAEIMKRSHEARSWSGGYSRGTAALHRGEWEKAAEAFGQEAGGKGGRVDGALYWRAWALHKLGRKDEAMAVLASLAKDHPQSRWSADAKALEVEVRQSSGQPVSPEEFSNEEIKLYALNGLAQTAPERALPMLDKILAGAGSPRMKERAVYVLAQVNSPEARQKLVQVAKGQGANPDMQLAAVRYLGTIRDSQSLPMLAEIYASTPDAAIKRQVLDAYAHHKDKARLLDAIQSEKDPGLRSAALSRLAGMRDAKALVDLARAEKDPKFKREIVRLLASMKSKEATDYLVEVLNQ